MAYTPINWQTGDVITAEKLNKMDNDWGVQNTPLFNETVTTAELNEGEGIYGGVLTYSQLIDADTITVTFDGTDYSCNRIDAFDNHYYGGFTESGPDFSVYPFLIESNADVNTIYTETAGTYTVSASSDTVVCGDNFTSAVQSIAGVFYITATWDETGRGYSLDKTYEQIEAEYNSGKLCRIISSNNSFITDLAPFGYGFTPYTRVSVNDNLLINYSFSLDQQTGLLMADQKMYTITPTP